MLDAAAEKNREGNSIPLRADLVEDLREWLADKAARLQGEANAPETIPFLIAGTEPPLTAIPSNVPLFDVPAGLLRILNRDLRKAGIPKRDERGRTLDVHALPHTFDTLLSKGGVAPRTAQAAMRHSSIDLTMNTYTDPKLLDVAGALDSLPLLPLKKEPPDEVALVLSATGTDQNPPSPLAPMLAPISDKRSKSWSILDNRRAECSGGIAAAKIVVSGCPVTTKKPLSSEDNGCQKVGATRRLLNFLSPGSRVGKHPCGGELTAQHDVRIAFPSFR
jgi:hypothetical protein